MGKITISLPNNLEEELRRRAIELYGYKKGSLSKAVTDAIADWLERRREKE